MGLCVVHMLGSCVVHIVGVRCAETTSQRSARVVVVYMRGRTRRRCTSCRSGRLTCLSTPMQQFASIRGLLRCSRSAAIHILLACLPSATVLIIPLSYQRRACLEKHERHRILCYDTGLVVCEENTEPMLHNSMYLYTTTPQIKQRASTKNKHKV